MRKLFVLASLMLGYNCFSTSITIENNRSNERFMLYHMAVGIAPTGEYLKYYSLGNDWYYFVVNPLDVYAVDDGDSDNKQFPFLKFPFEGTVYDGGGTIVDVPLPPTGEGANNSSNTTRFQLVQMRFRIDGMHENYLSMNPVIDPISQQILHYEEGAFVQGNLNLLPGSPPYLVAYARLGSQYYISIN